MNEDQFALLKVIESTMASIKDDVKEIKDSLKSKVENIDFYALKAEVEDLKKMKWTLLGVAIVASYLLNYIAP